MSNRVYLELNLVTEIDLEGNEVSKGTYVITGYDDAASCFQHVHTVNEGPPNEYIQSVFTPAGALNWLHNFEGEYDGLFSWALEHGMYIMGDWFSGEDLAEAWQKYEEDDD